MELPAAVVSGRGLVATPLASVLRRRAAEAAVPAMPEPGALSAGEAAELRERLRSIAAPEAEVRTLLGALADLRHALTNAKAQAATQALIDEGAIAVLVSRLRDSRHGAVQAEAAWVLTNMACGTAEQTVQLFEGGVVDALFETLLSADVGPTPDLCDQCLWALGNLAGEGVDFRDSLLAAGIVGVLGQVYAKMPEMTWPQYSRTQVLRSLTWLMSTLCRGSPAPALEEVDCAFDFFSQVLVGSDDDRMLQDALWGLCYLLEAASGESEHRARGQRLLTAGFPAGEQPPERHPVIVRVVECMRIKIGTEHPTFVPALRLLGQMISMHAPELTDVVLRAGALPALRRALEDQRVPAQVHRDAAWALQNIAAGTPEQAAQLADSRTCEVLLTSLARSPKEVSFECAVAVGNLARGGATVLSKLGAAPWLRLAAAALRAQATATANAEAAALQRALLDGCEAVLKNCAGSRRAVAVETGLMVALQELQLAGQSMICRRATRLVQGLNADVENESCGINVVAQSPSKAGVRGGA